MPTRMRHSPSTSQQHRHGWSPCISWGVAMVAAVVVVLIRPSTAQAKTFVCGGSDVQCLIAGITEANASKKKHTIQLEAGTYTLVDIENTTDGANGLPSITGNLTIQGASGCRT